MFYVGQKVLCVDVGPGKKENYAHWLDKGKIYTISGLDTKGPPEELAFFLEGLHGQLSYAWRFRPVVERKTDISIFAATYEQVEP